ncbi:MAG: helix-turn-helix transcriptional regulator [Bacteroidota bacterium]
MLFAKKIKLLRDERQMPQRQIAATLEIDTATYCKIEKGDRRAKREQVSILSELFKCNNDELLKMWLADQIYDVVKNEKGARDVLDMVQENIIEYGKK